MLKQLSVDELLNLWIFFWVRLETSCHRSWTSRRSTGDRCVDQYQVHTETVIVWKCFSADETRRPTCRAMIPNRAPQACWTNFLLRINTQLPADTKGGGVSGGWWTADSTSDQVSGCPLQYPGDGPNHLCGNCWQICVIKSQILKICYLYNKIWTCTITWSPDWGHYCYE